MGSIGETLKKGPRWVVVADEARVVVYERESRHGPLKELFELTNPLAREKTRDLLADRGGRSFDSLGKGRHTMAREKTDPKQHESIAFAKRVAARIVKAKREGKCSEFGLIAAPAFLGVLRKRLAVAGNVEPVFEIDKNVVGENTDFIAKLLQRELQPGD